MTTINLILIPIFAYLAGLATSPIAIAAAALACVTNFIIVLVNMRSPK